MALHDWKPARIRRLWAFGALAELLVIFAIFGIPRLRTRYAPPPDGGASRISLSGSADDSRRKEFYRVLRDSVGITVAVMGDSLTTFSRDSFSVTVLTRGDTLRALSFSPAAQRRISAIGKPIAAAWAEASTMIFVAVAIMLAVTLLPIPLALSAITLVWWRSRRRARTSGFTLPDTADEWEPRG